MFLFALKFKKYSLFWSVNRYIWDKFFLTHQIKISVLRVVTMVEEKRSGKTVNLQLCFCKLYAFPYATYSVQLCVSMCINTNMLWVRRLFKSTRGKKPYLYPSVKMYFWFALLETPKCTDASEGKSQNWQVGKGEATSFLPHSELTMSLDFYGCVIQWQDPVL